jgi:hypothetical protein
MNGKGSKLRPYNGELYRAGYDDIQWNRKLGDWLIEYEIPPCRAIYRMVIPEMLSRPAAVETFAHEIPIARIRKMEREQ